MGLILNLPKGTDLDQFKKNHPTGGMIITDIANPNEATWHRMSCDKHIVQKKFDVKVDVNNNMNGDYIYYEDINDLILAWPGAAKCRDCKP